ncbi:DNA cytosine methyltransferase [Thauera aromatica]|uniref:DNA (cytosine-5-)-methyltransferase n=1 Tax=Thauera aromatica K172 TaxID=44139 RepID=A0A2R4BPA1_THAAR|nr:DNA cytosine methyltransferase [Thauera aromatica]AVR89054.1 C-5 cytosine-specific DNA methylase [Thauera aromatica K172]
MKRDAFTLPLLAEELIIDNFAGGGGTSTGLEAAFGRPVDIAINHDPEALAMHAANHPHTRHLCESVWDVDPREIKGPVGLVWLSPDCKHFSKAKGGKPVEKKIRGLAWVALRWAAVKRPRVIMLENVEEFITWGPLIEHPDGTMRPCPRRKGREFGAFTNALRRQGYSVDWRELRACDYGAPTIRKRFFLIARRDGLPIRWPEPTHGHPASREVLAGHRKPWRTAAECIDWTLPCPSIFERKRPLADATLRRIAKGVMRYVVEAVEPFIVGLAHGEFSERAGSRTHALHDPMRTIHAGGGNFALVAPVLTECANASSPRSMPIDEPLRTICAETKGGHHALVAAFMAKHYGGVVGHELHGEPLHTVTSQDHNALVASHLVKLRNNGVGSDHREPLHTITGGGEHFGEVRAFLVKYYGTDQDPRLEEPLHTVTTKDRYGLVTVAGEQYQIADIGMRMLAPRELFRAQGFPEHYIIGDDPAQGLCLTKSAQVRMCGNSVCPPVAQALVTANFEHEKAWRVQA